MESSSRMAASKMPMSARLVASSPSSFSGLPRSLTGSVTRSRTSAKQAR